MPTETERIAPVLPLVALLLLAFLSWLLFFWQPAAETPAPASLSRPEQAVGVPAGGDFQVDTADGPWALSSQRGKWVLVYFGYTFCPDICPTSLAATAAALRQLTVEERNRLAMLFLTVDPERDDVRRLREYAAFFDPMIAGGRTSVAQTSEIAQRYGVRFSRQALPGSATDYVVDHSAETYLINPQGQLVARLPHAMPPDELLARLRPLLASTDSMKGK